jgi:hypothetical protein
VSIEVVLWRVLSRGLLQLRQREQQLLMNSWQFSCSFVFSIDIVMNHDFISISL